MEKRLFLAITLSFFVLYFWTSIFSKEKIKTPQHIANYEVIGSQEARLENKALDQSKQTLSDAASLTVTNELSETITTIQSHDYTIDFSDLGGVIKKISLNAYQHILPVDNVITLNNFQNRQFKLGKTSENRIEFIYENDVYKIFKEYLVNDDFSIDSNVKIINISNEQQKVNFRLDDFYINKSSLDNKDKNLNTTLLMEYSVFFNGFVERQKGIMRLSTKNNSQREGAVGWVGFRDQYFTLIVSPNFPTARYYSTIDEKGNALLDVEPKEEILDPGKTIEYKSKIYYGPQEISLLRKFDRKFEYIVDYKVGGFVDVMSFGMTDVIAKTMLSFFKILNKVIPNFGVIIILFAFLIYFITYPLTYKSMMSMKKMQAIQPKMALLKEKYKNNPQKLNVEVMNLYKENKVNPFGGCLPMLLQMPIFISLYQLLWRSFIFKGQSFLWIKDLSAPDRIYTLPFVLPYIGNELNVLPILYAILMFVQQKTSTKNMAIEDKSQQEMQRMMTMIMPIFLGFIFYKFSSGLNLYFTVYYLLTLISQWKLSKMQAA
jgi:YidC/Oxa1 family membrane protein insertase